MPSSSFCLSLITDILKLLLGCVVSPSSIWATMVHTHFWSAGLFDQEQGFSGAGTIEIVAKLTGLSEMVSSSSGLSLATVFLPKLYPNVSLNSVAKARQCLCHHLCTRTAPFPSRWKILWLQGHLLCFLFLMWGTVDPTQWDSEPNPALRLTDFCKATSSLDTGQGRGTGAGLFPVVLHHQVSQSKLHPLHTMHMLHTTLHFSHKLLWSIRLRSPRAWEAVIDMILRAEQCILCLPRVALWWEP